MTRSEFESFRLQHTSFAVVNLFVLAALLLLHTAFSRLLGSPSASLLLTLGAAFLLKLVELLWLRTRATFSDSLVDALTWFSIAVNLVLAIVLTFLTNREESPYFVLLAFPVLQAAYQFSLPALITIITGADAVMFLWVWHFATYHPPVQVSEYLEAGVMALLYTLVGLLVWRLVNQIKRDRDQLDRSLRELERTRERLAVEEKLAAVGRLSSAIAHEIRNPVAMIASSMATAVRPDITPDDREEMYAVAAAEAARLEKLTSDFLSYARPAAPRRAPTEMSDLLGYIAEVAGPHAARKGLEIAVDVPPDLCAGVDSEQVQRAVLNLVMNAIDAARPGTQITLTARQSHETIKVEVENTGEPIKHDDLARIFEPFYTTKPQGTGLGLAITRNIARSHGGDLYLVRNEGNVVCFALELKSAATTSEVTA